MRNIRATRNAKSVAAIMVCQSVLAFQASHALAHGTSAQAGPVANSQRQPAAAATDDLRGQAVTTFDFKVAPGPLASVLDGIAAQSGAKYRSESGSIPNVASPGVTGRMGLHEAVARALVGTGLNVVSVTNGEIRLASRTSSGTTEVVVTARRQTFKENFSSAATLTNTPIHETPATVDAVTQDVLESQNVYSLSEAIKNIPGALLEESGGDYFIAIGPNSTGGAQGGVTFTDGLRNGSLAQNEPTVLVDSIEVLKGPSSLLTGTEVGGGLVNYVAKRANGISPTEVSAGFGSGNEETVTADISGAIPHVDGLYFRVIGLAQHADVNPAGGNRPDQYVFSPMLGYRSDKTKVDLSFQYFSQRSAFPREDYMSLPSTPVSLANGPILSYGGLYNPNNLIQTSFAQLGYNLEQTLISKPDFTLELRAKGIYQSGSSSLGVVVPAALAGPFAVFVSLALYEPQTTSSHHVDLYSKFNTGPLVHQFIVGADYSLVDDRQTHAVSVALKPLGSSTPPSLPGVPYNGNKDITQTKETGVVFQDQVTWGPVHVLLGERGSSFEGRSTRYGSSTTANDANKWTPSAGLVLDLSKTIAIYESYNQQFSPQSAGTVTFSGAAIPPTLTTRYESGVKVSLLKDRLDLNGSYFSYTTSNEALTDPDPLHAGYSIAGPGERAHGVELAATGSLSPSLRVTAGYTYTVGSFIGGLPILEAPINVANAWVIKSFSLSDGRKIDVGFGGNYHDGYYIDQVGVKAPNNPPSFINTSGLGNEAKFGRDALTFDTSVAYSVNKLRFNLTIDNLFNANNYALSGGNLQLVRAEPRTARLVVTAKF
jgi:iron complex outermembrane receptor protein